MVISMILNFIYPPPPSVFMTAMSVVIVASLAILGLSEAGGVHLQYSKFTLAPYKKVPSRTGMLVLYSPAFLAGVASFLIFPDGGLRFLILGSAISLHFFKRILEVKLHLSLFYCFSLSYLKAVCFLILYVFGIRIPKKVMLTGASEGYSLSIQVPRHILQRCETLPSYKYIWHKNSY